MEVSGLILLQDYSGIHIFNSPVYARRYYGVKDETQLLTIPGVIEFPSCFQRNITEQIIKGVDVLCLHAEMFSSVVSHNLFPDKTSGVPTDIIEVSYSLFPFVHEIAVIQYAIEQENLYKVPYGIQNTGANKTIVSLNPDIPFGAFLCAVNYSFLSVDPSHTKQLFDTLDFYIMQKNMMPMLGFLQENPLPSPCPSAVFMTCIHPL